MTAYACLNKHNWRMNTWHFDADGREVGFLSFRPVLSERAAVGRARAYCRKVGARRVVLNIIVGILGPRRHVVLRGK